MRNHVAFEGGAGAVSDHRGLVRGANPHDFGDLFGRVRKHHRIGPVRVVPGFVLAVVVAHAGAGGQPLAEPGAQFIDCSLMFFCWHVHGRFLIVLRLFYDG